MRVVVSITVVLGLFFVSSPRGSYAESSGTSGHTLRLVSDDQPSPAIEAEGRKRTSHELEKPRSKDLPSLADLELNLDSSDIAKRHNLDSLSVQPWTPGRGSVGVKLEVTW